MDQKKDHPKIFEKCGFPCFFLYKFGVFFIAKLCFFVSFFFGDSFLEPKKDNQKPPQENPPQKQDGLIEGEELREFCSLKSPDLKGLMGWLVHRYLGR